MKDSKSQNTGRTESRSSTAIQRTFLSKVAFIFSLLPEPLFESGVAMENFE